MKKTSLSLFTLCIVSLGINAQTSGQGTGNTSGGSLNANAQWKTTGNTAQSSDFIGTTNQQSLIFKTNNNEAMRIDPTGKLIFSNLASSNGEGVVIVGGGGEGGRIDFTHNFSHVLNGQGIFTDISTFTGLKVSGSNIIQTTTGNVGIGTGNPSSKLTVSGDGRFSGNLYAQDFLGTSLTTSTANINFFTAPVSTFSGIINANAIGAPIVEATQALTLGSGQARIGYTPPNLATGNVNLLSFGTTRLGAGSLTNTCFYPLQNQWLSQFPDAIQIFNQYSQSANNINLLTMGYDGLNDFIDAAGINPNGNPSLLINYYCGKDVAICTGTGTSSNSGGTAGGFVFTGPNMQIGGVINPRNPNTALNIGANGSITTAVNIDANGNNIFNIANDGVTRIRKTSTSVGAANPILNLSEPNGADLKFYSNNGMNIASTANINLEFGGPQFSINETGQGARFFINAGTGNAALFMSDNNPYGPNHYGFSIANFLQTIFRVSSNGNILAPGLDIASSSGVYHQLFVDAGGNIVRSNSTITNASAIPWDIGGNSLTGGTAKLGPTDPNTSLSFITNNQPCMTITPAGYVHIIPQGVSSQIIPNGVHANALLSVSGEAIFKSAYVNVMTWSDYVFDKNYILPSLSEVEKFYLANKHLPGVPSAIEMEQNGDNIAETDAILLKKIEETTIYLVELKKEVELLKKENSELKKMFAK